MIIISMYIHCFLILHMLLAITGNVSSFFHHHFSTINPPKEEPTFSRVRLFLVLIEKVKMEISGSKAFIGSYSKGPSLNLRENRAYKANLSYIRTINWLLLYATHIDLIALVICSLNLPLHRPSFRCPLVNI